MLLSGTAPNWSVMSVLTVSAGNRLNYWFIWKVCKYGSSGVCSALDLVLPSHLSSISSDCILIGEMAEPNAIQDLRLGLTCWTIGDLAIPKCPTYMKWYQNANLPSGRLGASFKQHCLSSLCFAPQPKNSVWLNSISSSSISTLFDDECTHMSMAQHLNPCMSELHECCCAVVVNELSLHAMSCSHNASWFPWHDILNDINWWGASHHNWSQWNLDYRDGKCSGGIILNKL